MMCKEPEPPKPATPAHRILVVDDELGPRESLRLILTPIYHVVMAKDGEEALERFAAETPDMIISDIRMPRMNGIDLLKQVKQRSPSTPFILLTGFGTLESAQEAVRAGAFDYISKPYNVREIREVVAKALTAAQKQREKETTLARLQEANAKIEQTLRDLGRRAAVGDLSAEIIHDLNNPLFVLHGYVSMLETSLVGKPDGERTEEMELFDTIKTQAERCIELTRSFLDYARSSRHVWTRDNVNKVLRDTLQFFRSRLRAKSILLTTNLASDIPDSWVEPTPLHQVFYNLLINAIHALEQTGGEKTITVTSRQLAPQTAGSLPRVEVSIRDTGIGVPDAIRDRLFERFFTTKPQGTGTGLGLTICKRIVEEHQGTITVESTEGNGACFIVTLPLLTQAPDGGNPQPAADASGRNTNAR